MVFKRHNPGCGTGSCSCGGDCLIAFESYSSSPSSTDVDGWTELVGDWEIGTLGLEPDHAASDQRIRFETPSADLDCEFVAKYYEASAGDRVGVCLFLDADGDSYVAAIMTFGSGTLGRLTLSRYDNGLLTWTHDLATAPSCGTNAYDFDPAEEYFIRLSHKVVAGGRIWRGVVVDANDAAFPVSVDYFDPGGVNGLTELQGGLVTGTDANTAACELILFRHIYAPCVCHLFQFHQDFANFDDGVAWDRGSVGHYDCFSRAACDYPGAEYEEDVGDWDLEHPDLSARLPWTGATFICGAGNWLATEDVPARLLLRHLLRAPNAHYAQIHIGLDLEFIWHLDGLKWRWLWDYVDEDNYWCVEWEYGDWGGTLGENCDSVRVIQRAAGSETTQAELAGVLNRVVSASGSGGAGKNGAAQISAVLIDRAGKVAVAVANHRGSNPSLDDVGWFCSGPYTFTGAGRVGIEVVAAPAKVVVGLLWVLDGAGACEYSADCETFVSDPPTDPDPPEEPGPDDPTGCCDYETLRYGGEFEITINGITYYGGGDCLTDCTEIDSAFLTALNSTFTGNVTWKSDAYWEITANTGIDNPCDALTNDAAAGSMWVKIRIMPISAAACRAFGYIYIPQGGSCGVAYFEATTAFDQGGACTEFDLDWVSGNLNGCCLSATGASGLSVVKV